MKLPTVDGAVVGRAEADLVVGVMRAALGAWLDVVHVEREVFGRPGPDMFLVAQQHLAPNGGRHRLRGARWREHLIVSHRPVGQV
jgi:hypothetical protein